MPWPAIIAAGAAIAGGALGERNKRKASSRQRSHEREFAQKGIQWRADDARAAGLHPLAALGATGATAGNSVYSHSPMGEGVAQAGQAIGRGLEAKQARDAAQPPPGPVVFPSGSDWPHYTGKGGNAVPYSSQQASSYMALKNANAQLQVAQSQTRLNNANANAVGAPTPPPDMFTMFKHPRLGLIPFPNPDLGESAEALSDPYIAGQWMSELQHSTPKLYTRIVSEMATGKTAALTELLGAAPELIDQVKNAILKSMGQWKQ